MIYPVLIKKNAIHSDYLDQDEIDLLSHTFSFPSSFQFNVFHVTKEYIARPDLISLDAYGDSMFADVLCKINGISNPFELNEGMNLVLPSPDTVLNFSHDPSAESESEDKDASSSAGPTPAQKASRKRKANEAVIGDSRFRLDPQNGIIIY